MQKTLIDTIIDATVEWIEYKLVMKILTPPVKEGFEPLESNKDTRGSLAYIDPKCNAE